MDTATEPQPAPAALPVRLSWLYPSGLVSLSFVNFFLRFITLGIYNFWGKTEVRKRIWSAVRLDNEPMAYTGTGKELFQGFLIVFAAILMPLMLTSVAAEAFLPAVVAYGYKIALSALLFYLTGVALYRAQRYRLSRTVWRGIRGSLDGSSWHYGWTYVWTLALPFAAALVVPAAVAYLLTGGDSVALSAHAPVVVGVTLVAGLAAIWIVPWRSIKLQSILTHDMKFGDRPFTFTAPVRPLYARFAVLWAGCAVLAGGLYVTLMNLSTSEDFAAMSDRTDPESTLRAVQFLVLLNTILGVAFLIYYLLSAYYRAFQFNHFAAHTHFEGATFRGTATGPGLVRNAIGNFLIWLASLLIGLLALVAIVTIGQLGLNLSPESPLANTLLVAGVVVFIASTGLFRPITQARTTGYLARNLAIDGKTPLAAISQGANQGIKRGEGLAQAFDIDAF